MARPADEKERREALLALLDAGEGQQRGSDTAEIPALEETNPYQYQMWLQYRLHRDKSDYHIPLLVEFGGVFRVDLIRAAVRGLLDEEPVLRASFPLVNAEPVLRIGDRTVPEIPEIDCRGIPDEALLAGRRRFAAQDFTLENGPLYRFRLERLGEARAVLLCVFHHLVFDGGSVKPFFDRFSRHYQALSPPGASQGVAPRRRLAAGGGPGREDLEFWIQSLAHTPADIGFPFLPATTGSIATGSEDRDGLIHFDIGSGQLATLDRIARTAGATRFMLFLACYQTLLYRYSGHYDIATCGPVSMRDTESIREEIGCLLNTVVYRSDFTGNPPFIELLQRVKANCLSVYDHARYPFYKVLDGIRGGRHLHFSFQDFGFNFQQDELPTRRAGEVLLAARRLLWEPGLYPLTVTVRPRETGCSFVFSYQGARLSRDVVAMLANSLAELLAGIARDPGQRLMTLPCISEEDRLLLRSRLNRPGAGKIAVPNQGLSNFCQVQAATNLNESQLTLWLAQQLNPLSPVFQTSSSLTIKGRIDVDLFVRSLRNVIGQSDAMRTIVVRVAGIPHRRLLTPETIDNFFANPGEKSPFQLLDYSNFEYPENGYNKWAESNSRQILPLDQYAFETALIKCSDSLYKWYLKQHQMVTDAFSVLLITRAVMAEYSRLAASGSVAEPEPGGYFDLYYDRADSPPAGSDADYSAERAAWWESRLAGQFSPLQFYGRTRRRQDTATMRIEVELQAEWSRQIIDYGSRISVARSIGHVAFFSHLLALHLHLLTERASIRLGMPVHNRKGSVALNTPGLFMRMIPLVHDIVGDELITSSMKRASREVLASLRNAGEEIFSKTIASQDEFFDAYFNFNDYDYPDLMDGIPVHFEQIHSGHELYSLGLHVHLQDRFSLAFDFNRSVFSRDQAELFIQQYMRLLEVCLTDSQPVCNIDIGHQPVITVPDEASSEFTSLVEHLQCAVSRYPDNPAIAFGGTTLSYRELALQVDRVASFLRTELGETREKLVGILADRSIEAVVSILATAQSGAAFCCLDIHLPAARLQNILGDGALSSLLVCDRGDVIPELLATSPGLPLYDYRQAVASGPECAAPTAIAPGQLAYVIYTSGSTGIPKGVQIEHQSLANMLCQQREILSLGQHDRVLQFASLSFDASIFEMVAALCNGALLCIPDDRQRTVSSLAGYMREQRVSFAVLPPTVLGQLQTTELPALGKLAVAGEPCSLELARRWSNGRRFFNLYGPTEATVWTTAYEYAAGAQDDAGFLPLGTPIAGSHVQVINRYGKAVLTGGTGELVITGTSLARGYINRPDENRRRFGALPGFPGRRYYRTGDKVRYHGENCLEYMGRYDLQVKVRGFRVELGDVESAMTRCPGVTGAAARVVRQSGVDQLVAYVVLDDTLDVQQLREYLAVQLPEYMVPSLIIPLDVLPVTSAGKLDREALIPPEGIRPDLREPYRPPGNAAERTLALIWESVLGLDEVGIDDDFFEIGGNSVLLLTVINQAGEQGLSIDASAVYQSPTIAGIARDCAETRKPGPTKHLVCLQPQGEASPLFFFPAAVNRPDAFSAMAYHLGEARPVYFMSAPGNNNSEPPLSSIEELAELFIAEMKTVQAGGPYHIAGTCLGGVVALEVAQQLSRASDRLASFVIIDTLFPPMLDKPARGNSPGSYLQRMARQARNGRLLRVVRAKARRWVQRRRSESRLQMVYDAHTVARANYQAEPYPGQIVLIQSAEGVRIRNDEGWKKVAMGGLICRDIDCPHPQILNEPHIRKVAIVMNEIMEAGSAAG